ncbi:o-phthalyl amidase [Planctomycetes bacterium K23_9]|uniref:O-phthalyl amidase n=1 Tax=Stieleria marina TaxID=1930275 RepID=A0A517NM57_9BACT|nr:o-phthalyl amidase [Planctomycetes bacterium K23_9]
MDQRLDTCVWPSTDPQALNVLAKSLDRAGKARFCEYEGVERYNLTWVPTPADFVGSEQRK